MSSSNKVKQLEDWRDLDKLRAEVEAQKARVETLQTEQKWMKNSFSASNLCHKTNLDRSDSGIDRQSLIMEGRRTDPPMMEDCSTSSIKTIIEITSLIRVIEQQLQGSPHCASSMNMFNSIPRCAQQDPGNSSWIHNQLVDSNEDLEKLEKQLSQLYIKIFKMENVQLPLVLNGLSLDQLKDRVDEYYKLKTCLTDLATSPSCNSTAMIMVVKQLEPIAQTVENYLKLLQEVKNTHNEINVIIQRKNTIENKRLQLQKILQILNSQKCPTEVLPQSSSWNEPGSQMSKIRGAQNHVLKGIPSYHSSDYLKYTPTKESDGGEVNEIPKGFPWLPFNGNGISEDNPPQYDESLVNSKISHSRSWCHEYVNEVNILGSKEKGVIDQSIDLVISSFPYESIAIVQVKCFTLHHALQMNHRYRVRLSQLNGESSDWNTIYATDDARQISISPGLMLPISWNFHSRATLSLLLELQLFEKDFGSSSNSFMFNITPLRTTQKVSVALYTVQPWHENARTACDIGPSFPDQNRQGSLKTPRKTSIYKDLVLSNVPSAMHLFSNPKLNRTSPPVQLRSIRRSHTYSHDHQYCGKFECCSSIDFVSEPVPRMNPPKYISQPFNSPRPFRKQSAPESTCHSTTSSFNRQLMSRQPIRLKRNSTDREIHSDKLSQISDHQHNDLMIQDLWSVVNDLYFAMDSVSSLEERLLEFAYFKTRCPSNLLKLYNYFVETIFDPDQK